MQRGRRKVPARVRTSSEIVEEIQDTVDSYCRLGAFVSRQLQKAGFETCTV